ncbi:MAG: histidine--tRNA ligase [DPANN group archaeon]|nr:histidine--tRNA ligase [DPANN group archaeon]
MSKVPETVKGTRDFLPEEKIFRDEVIGKIKLVFELYGFSPLETPVLESKELLSGKDQYGDEALKLMYEFKDKAGRDLALRYDLTIPLARVVASNKDLPKPFKRYAIDRVWRYESPQKGRYREFYQCDVDIVGVASSLADAEIISCASDALAVLGIKKFLFRVNSRKLMDEILRNANVEENKIVKTLRVIDKLDKIGQQGVAKELRTFLSEASTFGVLEAIKLKSDWNRLSSKVKASEETKKEIDEFIKYLEELGVKEYIFDLSLARGLDYYTGLVFEIDAGVGMSLGGGGRYEGLIERFSGEKISATGITLGLERLMDILKKSDKKTSSEIFVIPINTLKASLQIVNKLRKGGINTDFDMLDRSISKNLDYVNKQNIPYALFVGEKELGLGKVKLKNMKSGDEEFLSVDKVIDKLNYKK